MGTGDWNDGMNRVGEGGKGESVWLGWFLYATLTSFAPLADARGDAAERASAWRAACRHAAGRSSAEAWDGDWYRRAYFDDGTPLGSAPTTSAASIPSRSPGRVISGAAEPGARGARDGGGRQIPGARDDEACRCCSRRRSTTPPHDPGYIKGYPPGIRENGGQYTHAAVWAVIAFAMLGDGDQAPRAVLDAQPDQPRRQPAPRSIATGSSPMSSCADVYSDAAACRPRRLDLVHRLGRHGCIASGWNGCSGFACRAQPADRSVHSARLARLSDDVPLPYARLMRSWSKTRWAFVAAHWR